MTTKDLVTALHKEAQSKPAFRDFALLCASRQRARKELTVRAVVRSMHGEGFNYPENEIAAVFKTLAELGCGRLQQDHKGRIRSLKEIKLTLQSLGKAALSTEQTEVKNFTSRTKYGSLPVTEPVKEDTKAVPIPKRVPTPVSLTVVLKGHPVTLPIPSGMSTDDVAALIGRLQGA